jgi:DNA-binding MarR family transcriptional regulator
MVATRTRKYLLIISVLFMLSGFASLALSGFGDTDKSLYVQDLSWEDAALSLTLLNGTSTGALSATGGTLVTIPCEFNVAFSTGAIFVALGTISVERRDERVLKLRDRIVDEISLRPGIHLRELHRQLGCAMGALQYHLRNLERDGLVKSVRNGNARHLFLEGYSADDQVLQLTSLSTNPTVKSILSECMAKGRVTQAELSRTLSIDKSLVAYYVGGLLKADILNTIRVFGRERPLVLTDWAHAALIDNGVLVH